MMRAVNVWVGTGQVASVTQGTTRKGDPVCSFMLGLRKDDAYETWVRVNVYGEHVAYCSENLKKGCQVVVQGELMNRRTTSRELAVTEVRCFDVQIVSNEMGERNE
jgi:hypothetical protein